MNDASLFHWSEPQADHVANCVDSFLEQLKQPTLISQRGKDSSRCRLFVTLLHGNEPSGLMALHRWLKSGEQPEVDCYFFIGAVEAAKAEPRLSTRHFSHLRDLNRCFYGPFHDVPGRIAQTLIELLDELKPEAVLDVHNTSGSGPSFAVSSRNDEQHIALTSLFTERLLLTDNKLGALMELTRDDRPIVTIECGGAIDPESARVAWDGLVRFVRYDNVLKEPPHDWNLEVLTDPIRITLTPDTSIAYGDHGNVDADVTFPVDVEHFNFGRIEKGTVIGELKQAGLQCIHATDAQGNERVDELLEVRGHELVNRIGLKCFMITSNPDIAKSDCLCYAVIDDSPE
ncbi:succinylglutamate desuccinylase/aspartoacylase family protein [Neiella marina]|uniref:Succinylglutamate desuccinylase/aspartoacylase family protein n=1 Tax=Neiella holothuriorum TaxID=2870530 RepID=A0ABS7EGJ2_9GAMM|nr:succinylglutamate desuccinylase/aspartoacylase family protein [Neiella holothuriorum]MBW8191461.1 succinylglutamate desuccinylase/aspartoacylase family protein [Neiella holothuriorum]